MRSGGGPERPRLRVITAAADGSGAAAPRGCAPVRLVAHAGLGLHRPGGVPNRASLQRALRLGVDTVELDVCASADRAIVLHHDTRTAGGTPIGDLTLAQLRRLDPDLLTVDDAVQVLEGRVRLVLDVKTPLVVAPLASWLRRCATAAPIFVCSERVETLSAVSRGAPGTALWQTFPRVGARAHERVLRVIAGLCAHRGRDAIGIAGDLADTIAQVRRAPRDTVARLAGLPWRRLLPELLAPVRTELGACGIAVHHALVTPELCDAAHALDLTVTAWTINDTCIARRVAGCGVDMITTDDVRRIRRAVPSRPHLVARRAAPLSVAY